MPIDSQQAKGIRRGFSEWAPTYDRETRGRMAWSAPRVVAQMLKDRLPGKARVLDLGCGTGQLAQFLKRPGQQWTGVDLSAEMLARARGTRRYAALRRMNVERKRYPFLGAAFDAAAASGVFEFTGKLGHALCELRRVLAPGGVLAFTVEATRNAKTDYELFESEDYHYARHRYGKPRILSLLTEAGLQLVKHRPIDAYLDDDGSMVRYDCYLARKA